jgi:hypothetical protein
MEKGQATASGDFHFVQSRASMHPFPLEGNINPLCQ